METSERWLRHFNPYHDKKGRFTSKVGSKIGKTLAPTIKAGKDKSPISPVEKVTKEASRGIESARKGTEAAKRFRNRNRKSPGRDLSRMTDQELRQRVNRMNLERQYNSLTEEDVGRGFDNAMDILDIFGSIVGIAGGVAGIMTAAYMLKKRTGVD